MFYTAIGLRWSVRAASGSLRENKSHVVIEIIHALKTQLKYQLILRKKGGTKQGCNVSDMENTAGHPSDTGANVGWV